MEKGLSMKMTGEALRFILVGIVNTIHYYLWYLLFSEAWNLYYIIGHWAAFLISMIGSFYLNTYFTYRTKPSWKKFFQFPITYIVNIAISTGALYALREWVHLDNRIAPIIATGIAIPFTFVISRRVLKGGE